MRSREYVPCGGIEEVENLAWARLENRRVVRSFVWAKLFPVPQASTPWSDTFHKKKCIISLSGKWNKKKSLFPLHPPCASFSHWSWDALSACRSEIVCEIAALFFFFIISHSSSQALADVGQRQSKNFIHFFFRLFIPPPCRAAQLVSMRKTFAMAWWGELSWACRNLHKHEHRLEMWEKFKMVSIFWPFSLTAAQHIIYLRYTSYRRQLERVGTDEDWEDEIKVKTSVEHTQLPLHDRHETNEGEGMEDTREALDDDDGLFFWGKL